MIGWHFSTQDETLNFGDGRSIVVGETHRVDPPIILCERGLHASARILDALTYAPGPILFKVELSGIIVSGDDKEAATHRKYIARLDCSDLLDKFSRACALSVAHLWDPSDGCMDFLLGDETARDDAWTAAWAAMAAARDAARAAGDAAWAAWDAARAAVAARAARDAAWAARAAAGAARDAAGAARAAAGAARDAAWAAMAAARDAARDAARAAGDAAWAAAWAEQNEVLTEYVLEAMG